jgi:hypothetical protein
MDFASEAPSWASDLLARSVLSTSGSLSRVLLTRILASAATKLARIKAGMY